MVVRAVNESEAIKNVCGVGEERDSIDFRH